MISMNSVQLIGKITLEPRVRRLKSGTTVAEIGMGIPENFKKKNGDWESRMHFVDIQVWDQQAEYVEKHLRKGDGLLVQGSLQFEQWEGKDGQKRNKIKVKAQRIQAVPLPPAAAKDEAA
jgi:single-strand DNA-binding protein